MSKKTNKKAVEYPASATLVAVSDKIRRNRLVLKHVSDVTYTANFILIKDMTIADIIVVLDDDDKLSLPPSKKLKEGRRVLTYPDFIGSSED